MRKSPFMLWNNTRNLFKYIRNIYSHVSTQYNHCMSIVIYWLIVRCIKSICKYFIRIKDENKFNNIQKVGRNRTSHATFLFIEIYKSGFQWTRDVTVSKLLWSTIFHGQTLILITWQPLSPITGTWGQWYVSPWVEQ